MFWFVKMRLAEYPKSCQLEAVTGMALQRSMSVRLMRSLTTTDPSADTPNAWLRCRFPRKISESQADGPRSRLPTRGRVLTGPSIFACQTTVEPSADTA